MKTMSKLAIALVGMAGVALAAETAQAQLVLNGAGSSAGRLFAGDSPALLCDAGTTPLLFVSSEGTPNKYEWQCTINGQANSIVRYSASASADGYLKQPDGAIGTAVYLNTATCPAGSSTTIEGVTVLKSVCPSTTPTQTLTVHWGGADVKAGSLHQTGNDGTGVIKTLTPPATSHLTTLNTVIVPFSIVVGGNVRGVDPVTGNPVPLLTLPEEQIRQIFNRAVTSWSKMGYTVINGGSDVITTCQRTIGSGTLATLDETIMRPKYWTGGISTVLAFPNVWNASSSNMVSCINGDGSSIGYLDSDSVTATNFPNGAYQVAIGGQPINNGALGTGKARLTALRCGRYPYWADWNFIVRTAGTEAAPINAPVGTDAAISQLQTLMTTHNPLSDYWLSEGDSFVIKNADRGPFLYQAQSPNGEFASAVCKGAASPF